MSATLTHGVDATALDAVPTDLLIGGRWTPAEGGRTLAVEDPATGEFLADVADASPGDGRAALDAADGARESWAGAPARERAELLRRAFDAVIAHGDAGLGREDGREGIDEYLETRYASIAL
jgi:succinate-semialdehyde dehydrogenase / glutarate-semialdehyde dehydrogenase